jgi:peptidoglycan/LPS O-acetylase OafA/YrhL
MTAGVQWAASFPNGGPLPGPPAWPPLLPRFPLTHLWFLYVLLELYAAALLLRAGLVLIDQTGRIRAGIDQLIAGVMRSPLAPAIPAIPVGIALMLDPTWPLLAGIRTPDQSLVTNLQAVVGFGTAFGFGWLLHRQIGLVGILQRRWMLNSVFALGLIIVSLTFASISLPRPTLDAARIAGSACYALAIWTTTFAAIGLALRFLSGFSPVRRYLADASYWLYLIHLPIVLALQVALSALDWPALVKFAIILLVALPVMLISYPLMVRHSCIGAVLNGARVPRRAKTEAGVARSATT